MASREQTTSNKGRLAMVTGASSGIGYELAILCAKDGFDLIVAADDPKIEEAAKQFQNYGVEVTTLQVRSRQARLIAAHPPATAGGTDCVQAKYVYLSVTRTPPLTSTGGPKVNTGVLLT
jgi:NADP-dependent 3-hydroxy acid dehydrogenase YdfG